MEPLVEIGGPLSFSQAASDTGFTLPPAQPHYILRGHSSQIHAVAFLRHNSRLLTGDADGWVVVWNLSTRRPVTVWRAHQGPILALSEWPSERVITHGRDSTLKVWQIKSADEENAGFSTVLPVDDATASRKQPWLLHDLAVNTLTFCGFAFCREEIDLWHPPDVAQNIRNSVDSIYLAVPSTRDSEVDVYRLPTERRLSTVRVNAAGKGAMVMALHISFYRERLTLIAGYENGSACILNFDPQSRDWHQVYASQVHGQPVLSLDLAPSLGCFFTSSADDIIARHPLQVPGIYGTEAQPDFVHTKHSGQQSLQVRSDERILATAGWDRRIRIYSTKSLEGLAVLKWHKEGCYAVAFAEVAPNPESVARDGPVDPDRSQNVHAATDTRVAGTLSSIAKTTRQRREAKAQSIHWIAAGSKDGKVSLWDIY